MEQGVISTAPFERLFPRATKGDVARFRAAAEALDAARPAANAPIWHWKLDHASFPGTARAGTPVILSTSVSIYDRSGDWAEVELDVSWTRDAEHEVTAQLGIACRCDFDHGTHYVERFANVAAEGDAVAELFEAAVRKAIVWIAGPIDPNHWRVVANLP